MNPLLDVLDELDMALVMSVNPGWGGQEYLPEATEKIRRLREEANRRAKPLDIEVDGGIHTESVRIAAAAGANIVVAGSALFDAADMAAAVRALREAAG